MSRARIDTGLVAIGLAAASWGTIGVAVAGLYRLGASDALSVGFWRLALSAPALLLLSRAVAGPGGPAAQVHARDRLPLVVMGAAFAAYQVCYFAAIPLIGVAAAVLVNIGSAPLITALLSGVIWRERLAPVVGLAMAGAVAGAALLVGGSPTAANTTALLGGTALALGAGFAYSLVALAGRTVAPRYHPLQPVTLAATLSVLLLAPLVALRGLEWRYPPAGWVLLLYLATVPTVLGYALYLRGLRTTSATVSTIVVLVEPVVSTLLAVALLGERLSPAGALGGALVLGSVGLLYWRQRAPQ